MMMLREAFINYMTPLGLHHIMQVDFHYARPPARHGKRGLEIYSIYPRAVASAWDLVRSSTGSNAISQYFLSAQGKV